MRTKFLAQMSLLSASLLFEQACGQWRQRAVVHPPLHRAQKPRDPLPPLPLLNPQSVEAGQFKILVTVNAGLVHSRTENSLGLETTQERWRALAEKIEASEAAACFLHAFNNGVFNAALEMARQHESAILPHLKGTAYESYFYFFAAPVGPNGLGGTEPQQQAARYLLNAFLETSAQDEKPGARTIQAWKNALAATTVSYSGLLLMAAGDQTAAQVLLVHRFGYQMQENLAYLHGDPAKALPVFMRALEKAAPKLEDQEKNRAQAVEFSGRLTQLFEQKKIQSEQMRRQNPLMPPQSFTVIVPNVPPQVMQQYLQQNFHLLPRQPRAFEVLEAPRQRPRGIQQAPAAPASRSPRVELWPSLRPALPPHAPEAAPPLPLRSFARR